MHQGLFFLSHIKQFVHCCTGGRVWKRRRMFLCSPNLSVPPSSPGTSRGREAKFTYQLKPRGQIRLPVDPRPSSSRTSIGLLGMRKSVVLAALTFNHLTLIGVRFA